jgi:hypothetical protein
VSYDIGDLVTCDATFRDPRNRDALVDPATVVIKVRNPDGIETTSTPERVSTGRYTHEIDVDQAGVWSFRFESGGDYQGAQGREFYVRAEWA